MIREARRIGMPMLETRRMSRKQSKLPPKKRRTRAERQLAAAMLGLLRQGYDLRSRKTRRARGAIRANRYENELKLQIAADRLIDELG